jgi:hypothetical protein
MNILYYYYYLFYYRILRDNEPHLLTTIALSASISFPLGFLIRCIFVYNYCQSLNPWINLGIFGLILGVNYKYFHLTGRAKKIIKKRPTIAGSKKIAILITVIFFLLTLSFIYWGPIYMKYLLDNCR